MLMFVEFAYNLRLILVFVSLPRGEAGEIPLLRNKVRLQAELIRFKKHLLNNVDFDAGFFYHSQQ